MPRPASPAPAAGLPGLEGAAAAVARRAWKASRRAVRIDAASWPVDYPAQVYVPHQRRKADARRQREVPAGYAPAPEQASLVEAWTRAAANRVAIKQRQLVGFQHPGGPLPGHPGYWREPFTYPGLVSDEGAGLKHFAATAPTARHLRTGDYPGDVQTGDPKIIALDRQFIEDDRRMRGKLCVKIDRIFPGGFAELEDFIAGCGLPLPNHEVGHLDAEGRLHCPHLIYRLLKPVAFAGRGGWRPRWLFSDTLFALTEKLRPIGAEPVDLANAAWMRNPLSPLWARRNPVERPYTLREDRKAPDYIALVPYLNLPDRPYPRRTGPKLSPEDCLARQVEGGRNGGKKGSAARAAGSLAAVTEAIRRLTTPGRRLTRRKIATDTGLHEKTVGRHWDAAQALAAKPDFKALPDRKDVPSSAPPAPAVPAIHKSTGGRRRPTPIKGEGRAAETPCGLVGGVPGPSRSRFRPSPSANAACFLPYPSVSIGRRKRPGGGACAEGGREPPCAETRRRPPSAGPPRASSRPSRFDPKSRS